MANENIKGKDEGVKERCQYELYLEKYYGLSESVNPEMKIHTNYSDLVNMLAMYDSENKKVVDREEGWISVEERKPEKDKKVWVAFGDKDVDEGMYVDWDEGQVVFVDAIQRWRYVFQPTHWKPFIVPSPPNNK